MGFSFGNGNYSGCLAAPHLVLSAFGAAWDQKRGYQAERNFHHTCILQNDRADHGTDGPGIVSRCGGWALPGASHGSSGEAAAAIHAHNRYFADRSPCFLGGAGPGLVWL